MGFKSSQTIYFSLAINCERELQSGGADNLMVTKRTEGTTRETDEENLRICL